MVDAEGQRLRRVCLYAEDPGCGCGDQEDYPIRIRQAVAFDKRAARIVLYRCEEELAGWEVTVPPHVEVDCRLDEKVPEQAVLSWKVEAAIGEADDDEYWSLVQWQDRAGTWRGLAPRFTGRSLLVPRFLPGVGRHLRYRVLVTQHVATGVGYWEGTFGDDDYRPNPPEVVLVGVGRTAGTYELPRIVTATTVGGGDHPGRVRWFDAAGGELSRGSRLDLGRLRRGGNVVAAIVVGSDVTVPGGQWLIERTEDDRFLLRVGDRRGEAGGPSDEPPAKHEHPHDDHHHHPHTHDERE